MEIISSDNKNIAKFLVSAFSGNPTIKKHWDKEEYSSVDILSCQDSPIKTVNSFGTVGLSDFPLIKNGEEYPANIEILGACNEKYADFSNIIATAAFCIINSQWFCSPGIVFPDIVLMYYPGYEMKHLYFTYPFLWKGEFEPYKLDSKSVSWLMAIPVSDQEKDFVLDNGPERLEELFLENNIDVCELTRNSIIGV